MDIIDILEALNDSIQTLRAISLQYRLASGSTTIWRLVDHAQDHLDRQIKELLAPPAEAHRVDTDCTVDPRTSLCTGCGVYHGGSCPSCTGRGFHAASCARVEDWARN